MIETTRTVEFYRSLAGDKSNRQLLAELRDARRSLDHNGRHSFAGKEAKKEIAAIEAEFVSRGFLLGKS